MDAHANGPHRMDWPGLRSTGDAATAKGWPFMPNTLPLPLPCRDRFFPPNEKYSGIYLVFARCTNTSAATDRKGAKIGFSAGSRSDFGGGLAGTRDRAPDLAPAQAPLACPLVPTGGDALSALYQKEKEKEVYVVIF